MDTMHLMEEIASPQRPYGTLIASKNAAMSKTSSGDMRLLTANGTTAEHMILDACVLIKWTVTHHVH